MKKNLVLLVIITLLGLFLRIYQLSSRPVGFTWDEAALGYNAYSLLNTARDEYGIIAPVVFKSFGDFKPGAYIYFTVSMVKLLGLTEFAVRLPGAIFGTLLILLIYILVRRIFPQHSSFAACSAFLLAINPWAIQFSRGAWEANLNLLLVVLGTILFLRKKYPLSGVFYGLTFWSYQGAKLFTPLIVLSVWFVQRQKISFSKTLIFASIIFLFLIPILVGFSSQSGRLKVFSVFSYTRNIADINTLLAQDNLKKTNLVFQIFHGELIDQGRGILERYLNHFSPKFLFFNGDWTSLRQSVYTYGYFYLPELVLLILGFIYIFKNIHTAKLLIFWIIFAPLPSAFSRDSVSGVRSLPLLIPLIIICGIGLSEVLKRKLLIPVYCLLMGFFISSYLDLYYLHNPFYSAIEWVYPYKQAIQIIKPQLTQYSHIYFTDKLGQPYIFFLFYLKIDPRYYQAQALLNTDSNGDVGSVSGFDKFIFRPIFWPELRGKSDSIFVGDQYELPEKDLNINNLRRLGEVYYPNGQVALRLVSIK